MSKKPKKLSKKNFERLRACYRVVRPQAEVSPTNITLTVDEPFKGDKTAKLTLVDFSDYQCPFCARFFRETLPQIEKDYILTGKVKYVFRDFPLEIIHREAFKAHEAAHCAGDQGKCWEMHDRLFQNQTNLGPEELPKHAEAIGLSSSVFQKCLGSEKHASRIRKEIEHGRKAGVQGTPTFFLGSQDSDARTVKVLRMIQGAQSYAQFKEAIDGALNEIKK